MKKIIFTLLLLSTKAAFAVLPPLWQGVVEIEAILKSPELPTFFTPGDAIQEISKQENTYTIRSLEKECFVDIVYLPSDRLGPAQFALHFHVE